MWPNAQDLNYVGLSGAGYLGSPLVTGATADPLQTHYRSQGIDLGNDSSMGSGLGWNLDTLQLALGGLNTIGNIWQAWEANKLAKQQFKAQKEFANINLANQIQSYNTALEDRGRSRAHTEGQDPAMAAAWISSNRLPERRV